jgi:uncharacterized membrane protein YraQ (UPF0718 family)
MQASRTTDVLSRPILGGMIGFLAILGGLITYKAGGAMGAIAKVQGGGTLSEKSLWFQGPGWSARVDPLVHAVNYMGWVTLALVYGLLIGAAVRAVLPRTWLARTIGAEGARGQLLASLAGAPLMLCSCCATPVFEGVYRRTGRLGPSLAMLVAPPALNPGALALTFLLFPAPIGWTRLGVSLALVWVGMAWVGGRVGADLPPQASALELDDSPSLAVAFGQSLKEVTLRSLPAILLGILLSAWLITAAPIAGLTDVLSGIPLLLLATLLAVVIAIPTFAEIPIGLALLHAGAPQGIVLAVMVAGPAINLPSLFGIATLSNWRVALATGTTVFGFSVVAGLAI